MLADGGGGMHGEGPRVRVVYLAAAWFRLPAVFVPPRTVVLGRAFDALAPCARRVVLAHEYGHVLLYARHGPRLARWSSARVERVADALGARWLVPDARVGADLRRTDRLQVLAAWWRVPWWWAVRRVHLYAADGGALPWRWRPRRAAAGECEEARRWDEAVG